jgi:hypothetical protein
MDGDDNESKSPVVPLLQFSTTETIEPSVASPSRNIEAVIPRRVLTIT